MVFIDDTLIYWQEKGQHKEYLKIVLETLIKEMQYTNKKCEFGSIEQVFLVKQLLVMGVEVDPTKVEMVTKWNKPINADDV